MDLTQKSRRKFWLKVHLYLGLFAGAVFVLIGLTGSMLAFGSTLDVWLNPTLMMTAPVSNETGFLPWDDMVTAGLKTLPPDGKVLDLEFPRHPGLAAQLWFEQPAPNANYLERHQVFINPFTGLVTGERLLIDFERPWRNPLMDFILRLHYSLALGSMGMTIVGFIGLALLFSILTGLILWWPSPGKLRQALKIKLNASFERLNFDLHKTCGFYTAIILVFLILSGVYLIFPDYGRALVSVFSPVAAPWPMYQSTVPKEYKKPISLAEVKSITDARFPDGEYCWIVFPQNDSDVYLVGKREINEVNLKIPYRSLWIDQYSGKIIHAQDSSTRTAGDIFVEWLYPLHTGEAFGVTGQLIILISGLMPVALYVTGFIRWLQKRRAKKLKGRQVCG